MGRPFLEHLGGRKYYTCARCETYLSNKKEILSQTFRGATGQAFLFRTVVNITMSRIESRILITGQHIVRDVFCKNCNFKLGWMYEFAHEPQQSYKEGHVILEREFLEEKEESDPGLMRGTINMGLAERARPRPALHHILNE